MDEGSGVVDRDATSFVVLNAFPYGSGHVLVLPRRHVAGIDELDESESAGLWGATTRALRAVALAYRPDGANLGANLGRAAGAGIPGHLHLHVLPRWGGDTNFMTSVAETRVLPESLAVSFAKLRAAYGELD
jgi:ATP adenylyltransferase